jgi:uncharacterized protein YecA (UPF0149 family)
MALSFFASIDIAETFRGETNERDLGKMATKIRRVFPNAVAEYAHIGRGIQKTLLTRQVDKGRQRRKVKVGPNEPCPCGSGRKYKVCCGA